MDDPEGSLSPSDKKKLKNKGLDKLEIPLKCAGNLTAQSDEVEEKLLKDRTITGDEQHGKHMGGFAYTAAQQV